ncbi:Alpha/beta hydrolase fold-1 [Mycena sp. CBHHK59/15]|nr:Alpha/beta hydrolase fold-1 [Mycena sp. CBHHK59/15]
MPLDCTPYTLDCPPSALDPPGRSLKMAAKRYCTSESAADAAGLTLLFAHCIGAHKEQWEPTIAGMFALQNRAGTPRHQRVREAWAFDWQNHGDSAVLNRELLLGAGREDGVSAFEWAGAIAAFVRSPRMQGQRIVAIGHSAGAGTMVVSTQHMPTPPYAALVLIEPSLAAPPLFHAHVAPTLPAIVAATTLRRASWASRAEAHAWLAPRAPWRGWDARVLQAFVDYGLHETSDGDAGVALKCAPQQEAVAYPDVQPHFAAVRALPRIGAQVHVVWASRSEWCAFCRVGVHRPQIIQNALADAVPGRTFASVTRVEGGHMLVQEQPDRMARAICDVLDSVDVGLDGQAQGRVRSRL